MSGWFKLYERLSDALRRSAAGVVDGADHPEEEYSALYDAEERLIVIIADSLVDFGVSVLEMRAVREAAWRKGLTERFPEPRP